MIPKISIIYNKLVMSSGDVGRNKRHLLAFNKDLKGDLFERLDVIFDEYPNLLAVDLKNTVPVSYRSLYRPLDLKNLHNFLRELSKGASLLPENNFKVVVNFYTFYLMFICKSVDNFVSACHAIHYHGEEEGFVDYEDQGMDMVGITKKELAFYETFLPLRGKSVDEWYKLSITDVEEKYITSAFKRIYKIYGY